MSLFVAKDGSHGFHRGIFSPKPTLNPVLDSMDMPAVVAASVALAAFGFFGRGDLAALGIFLGMTYFIRRPVVKYCTPLMSI
jgi:hypothetical protein